MRFNRPVVVLSLPLLVTAAACSSAQNAATEAAVTPVHLITLDSFVSALELPSDPARAAAVQAASGKLMNLSFSNYYEVILANATNDTIEFNGQKFSALRDQWIANRADFLALGATYENPADYWRKTGVSTAVMSAEQMKTALASGALGLADAASGNCAAQPGNTALKQISALTSGLQLTEQLGPQLIRSFDTSQSLAAHDQYSKAVSQSYSQGAAYKETAALAPATWLRSSPQNIPAAATDASQRLDWNSYGGSRLKYQGNGVYQVTYADGMVEQQPLSDFRCP